MCQQASNSSVYYKQCLKMINSEAMWVQDNSGQKTGNQQVG